MKVEIGTKFKIGFKAKKHNDEFIWREGMWTEGCGLFGQLKSGKLVFTYYGILFKMVLETATSGRVGFMKQIDNKEIN